MNNLINIYSPDLIFITETWLKPDYQNNLLNLDNYQIYRKERLKSGEGLLMGINKNYKSELIICSNDAELLAVDLNVPIIGKLRLILIYIPTFSNHSEVNVLAKEIYKYSENIENLLILGDFNITYPNTTSIHRSSKSGKILINLFESLHPIYQMVNFPTRGPNTIDLLFVSKSSLIRNLSSLPPVGSSDHVVIVGALNFNITKTNKWKIYRNFNKANFDKIQLHLEQSLNCIQNFKTASDSWTFIQNDLKFIISNFLPISKIRLHKTKIVSEKAYHLFNKL